ncbi:HynC [Desulfamplus magnetovallimortis]|uniref:HynC n=1 Tax=Desulfamplus magnetovallimortis TaxID=1246637 RepID=A0A1W1HG37_9BACT|nr:HyaD/HybD family hydrogenase maturation endopeptidase [Desulfamplus magnetovallimortis]SLM31358.1 HynC [Desulfamplus magnetovallimortis]
MKSDVMVLGVGNILYSDDGFGIRVVEKLQNEYDLPDNIEVVDGGVLGINLLGVISSARRLIVVDTIINRGKPGDLHRLEGDDIPNRILGKNSIHQVDLLEALSLCRLMGNVPETVILGVEPQDISTLSTELTPAIAAQVEPVARMILKILYESLGNSLF